MLDAFLRLWHRELIPEEKEWKGERDGGMWKKEGEKRKEEQRKGKQKNWRGRNDWSVQQGLINFLEKRIIDVKGKRGGQEEQEKSSETHLLQNFGLDPRNENK